MKHSIKALCLLLLSLLAINCSRNKPSNNNRVVIGISTDIQTLSPLYSFNLNESYITDMLYLSLVQHNWDDSRGELISSPMLAQNWEWNDDSTTITLFLRNDVFWSDSVKVTSEDVVYSFDLYSDPDVKSRFYGTFKKFYTEPNEHIDLAKTFEVIDPYKLKIHFNPDLPPDLFSIDLPVLPKHIYDRIDRKDIENSETNFKPVSNGPYKLKSWEKNQRIILEVDPGSFLANSNSINQFVFSIVPDYNLRLQQLTNGELDFITNVKPEDLAKLKSMENITTVAVKGREYDYLGWNNIDPVQFNKNNKMIPHKLFGNPEIRKALTYALNRNEVIESFLYNNGELAVGPVSPIFKSLIDKSLKPYQYNPGKAIAIFAKEGWHISPKDGILEKDGNKFSFKLYLPAGNPRRDFAIAVYKNNLKAVGVDMQVEKMEMSGFIQKLYSRELDAWTAGWSITIPIELKPFWYSDPEIGFLNLSAYSNKRVDKLLNDLESINSKEKKVKVYKEIQNIIHNDVPCLFLYWIDNIVAYNNTIQNTNISPLGAVNKTWEWTIKD